MSRSPCELFVPKVKGSNSCSICERNESDHSNSSPYWNPSQHSSKSTSPLVAPSLNSAFSLYKKNKEHPDSPILSPRRPIHRRPIPQGRILNPRPRRAHPPTIDNRSESNLTQKIEDDKRLRSNSAGNRLDDDTSSSGTIDSRSPSPIKEEPKRARNFQKILTRFQNASEPSNLGRNNRRITVGTIRLDGSPQYTDSPSVSRRSSLHGNSPSRTNSARSTKGGRQSLPSPISHYVPESSIRRSSNISSHRSPPSIQSDSPFSIESIPSSISKPIPLTISIPSQQQNSCKRLSLPSHWVKETDIDDPSSFNHHFTSIASPDDPRQECTTFVNPTPMVGATRETFERRPMLTGNCRRLADYQNNIMNGKRNKEENKQERNGIEGIKNEGSIASRSSFSISPGVTLSRQRAVENNYSQMCSSHVSTLSWIAEKLNERSTKEEISTRGPFSTFTFHHLHMNRSPALIKGSAYFFDATFVKDRKEHEVTVMISPHSHYAPVIRRGLGINTYGEIEDIDGSIAKFLRDHMEEEPPSLKAVVMPRMKLCSLHALAAQNLHRTMEPEQFEAHIVFVLIRLLSALKMLQLETDGIESLSTNFREFLLVYRTWKTCHDAPQLLFLPDALDVSSEESESEQVGLCRYALRALCTLLHHRIDGEVPRILDQTRYSRALLAAAISLHSDKSSSLSTSKQLLELSLWGQGTVVEGDFEAKLWMDSRRSECINQLLRSLLDDSNGWEEREKLRIDFLLSTTPRSLSHAHSTLAQTTFD